MHQQTIATSSSAPRGLAACVGGQLWYGTAVALDQTCVRKSCEKPCWGSPPFTQVLLLLELLHRCICAWLYTLLILTRWFEFLVWHCVYLITMDLSGNKQTVGWFYYNHQSSSALLAQVPCTSLLWNLGTRGWIFKPSPLLTISNICVQFRRDHRTSTSHSPNTSQYFLVYFTHESRDSKQYHATERIRNWEHQHQVNLWIGRTLKTIDDPHIRS